MQLKDAIGRYGEAVAVRLLIDSGYRLIETNWRCRRGEIDIVASAGNTLVICEVKTRSSVAFGEPAEAVGRLKSSRLRLLATQWLAEHPGSWDAIRFDVISVLRPPSGPAQVRHLRGAF
ncbi:MAG: YraN family protein [Actinomycetota bacterium]|nr:YraN family protein [Actinomycetota bacterium]MDQ2957935.1 YraN family protein [Actinomycetota bacterium]